MREWCDKEGVEVWAYCLMTNHVHLIAVPERESALARGIGEAHRRYTRAINFRENWRGYLWQGRFASCPMDEEYLHVAVRYVEMNPVRARMVERAWDYPWSGAPAHIRGDGDQLVKVRAMLDRVEEWPEFLGQELSETELAALRRHSRTGRPLGSTDFVEHLETILGRGLRPKKTGPKGPWKHTRRR
jgi:putative transposase